MDADPGVQKFKVRLTFTEPLLGSAPLNKDVYTQFIASKAPAAVAVNGSGAALAEVETITNADEKGRTGFHRDEAGNPILLDYVIKGFLKESCGKQREQRNRLSTALKAYKTKINGHVFVFPRELRLRVPRADAMEVLERPLRAETMQGPRVALASSEMLPAGTYVDVELHVLAPDLISEELIREWFAYGKYMGLGQWRSGSFGRFDANVKRMD